MRYFRLLVGIHQEPGKKNYTASETRDEKTGEVIEKVQPIVPSEKDLAKLFGPEKFTEVPLNEVPQHLLQTDGASGESRRPETPDVTEVEDDVSEAVQQGAKDITPPKHGRDVTQKFPSAISAKLKVYMKPGGKHTITDDETGEVLTAGGPIRKDKVVAFIESYLDT